MVDTSREYVEGWIEAIMEYGTLNEKNKKIVTGLLSALLDRAEKAEAQAKDIIERMSADISFLRGEKEKAEAALAAEKARRVEAEKVFDLDAFQVQNYYGLIEAGVRPESLVVQSMPFGPLIDNDTKAQFTPAISNPRIAYGLASCVKISASLCNAAATHKAKYGENNG